MTDTLTPHTALDNINEYKLLMRTQQGDAQAFNPLVVKCQPKIESLIYRQVHNRETAQDLTLVTFLKMFVALPNFCGDSAFYSWKPDRIAQNVVLDYRRRQHKRAKS